MASRNFRILELFCGIGGLAAAIGERAEVVQAIDIHRGALQTYRCNFGHATSVRTIESMPAEDLCRWEADLWWLSPPCQPYTRRGLQRDLEDSRAQSLLNVISALAIARPPYVALENVPQFEHSRSFAAMCQQLDRCGYSMRTFQLCPTQFGWPNRRKRFYLVAGRDELLDLIPRDVPPQRLQAFLDPACHDHPSLQVAPEQLRQFEGALHLVDQHDSHAITSCFTAAYGRSPVRSGSYLRTDGQVRRFAPHEILWQLGFDRHFQFPAELPIRTRWTLAGNSLSVPVVRGVLGCIPALRSPRSAN